MKRHLTSTDRNPFLAQQMHDRNAGRKKPETYLLRISSVLRSTKYTSRLILPIKIVLIIALATASFLFYSSNSTRMKGSTMSVQEKIRVRAPELTGGRGWLNTDKPLSLAALKGKVVLLDFWTYGCINCIHIVPDLKRLEHKYANQLVVIGVHSAKFENEKDTENIRRII
ncbi:MAG: redoxin domain-containing protein, partial [Acidobacteriota bacterium]|nr:redoxin domain-containing protein [Acidobacteriota bacterium]